MPPTIKAAAMARTDAQSSQDLSLYDPLSDVRMTVAADDPLADMDGPQRYYFEDPRARAGAWNVELADHCTLSCRHCYQRPTKCEPSHRVENAEFADGRALTDVSDNGGYRPSGSS